MRAVIINKSDARGGAAVVSRRLMHALRDKGVDARMLVAERLTDDPFVVLAASPFKTRIPFMMERAEVFVSNGFNRDTLFKIDPASFGLPLWKHPLVKEADVVMLNWMNQGMLSLKGVARIAAKKPVIWTMHDLWCATGICHHPGKCEHFQEDCGCCPLLGRMASGNDLSFRTHKRKINLELPETIQYVAVSSWLESKCHESSLLCNVDISVIPNPFRLNTDIEKKPRTNDRIVAVMAAARLDDDVKGLPILIKALEILRRENPRLADRLHFIFCGSLRNEHLIESLPVSYEWKGPVTLNEMEKVYAEAQIVVSSSRYETLPGTLVEGQAFGALPVAFDRGGQRDIVEEGVTGVLAPFGDSDSEAAGNFVRAIEKGVSIVENIDPEQLTSRLQRSVSQKFSSESVADKYIWLINHCISIK